MQVKQISICSEFYKQKWILLKFDMKVITVYSLINVQWKIQDGRWWRKMITKVFFVFTNFRGSRKRKYHMSRLIMIK
jgi:hypothetical protein